MRTPPDFEPVCRSAANDGAAEYLEWLNSDAEKTIYPRFFRTS